ncbi:hypothetical protein WMY93_010243 [Mugilogobius chulae]|uniref:TIR domain-containing protein n=1 Tax=Mugilogobius chulae TaxID=88201 RepID=A0AAW0PAL8_9GOBI
MEENVLSEIDSTFVMSVVDLNVNRNYLGWLQKGAFRNWASLTNLQLKSIGKTIVEEEAFEGLSNLTSLTYSPSPHSIGIFSGLPSLKQLTMFLLLDEPLNELADDHSLNEIPSLNELSISSNSEGCYAFTYPLFKGFKKLEVVLLDTYCCDFPYSNLFHYNTQIVDLQFTNCREFGLEPELFHPMREIKNLEITHSNITSMEIFTKANLTKVEKLILKNNELTFVNVTVFDALPSLKYLDLSGNPFVCECSNADFIVWAIQNQQVQVVNAFRYTCASPASEEGHLLMDFNVQSCWEFTGFFCFMSSSALVLLTLLCSFIFHFLQWQLVYGFYLLQAFLYDTKKRRQGCPHIYDAFVSYNVDDEEWVYGELLPELEEVQGWRLCLHHRDFQPGKPIIENITDAIYSSRKTLCVISRRYLQSEWCSREIQMASFRLFDEKKDVLVLLFLEEISSHQLTPFYRMRKLVKSRTYLSWTQAWSHKGLFWENVRRALECGNEPGDNHNPLA